MITFVESESQILAFSPSQVLMTVDASDIIFTDFLSVIHNVIPPSAAKKAIDAAAISILNLVLVIVIKWPSPSFQSNLPGNSDQSSSVLKWSRIVFTPVFCHNSFSISKSSGCRDLFSYLKMSASLSEISPAKNLTSSSL